MPQATMQNKQTERRKNTICKRKWLSVSQNQPSKTKFPKKKNSIDRIFLGENVSCQVLSYSDPNIFYFYNSFEFFVRTGMSDSELLISLSLKSGTNLKLRDTISLLCNLLFFLFFIYFLVFCYSPLKVIAIIFFTTKPEYLE